MMTAAPDLRAVRCFVSDMDGTFYLGERLLPGSLRFAALLRERGVRLLFLTNNSSKAPEEYAAKLTRLGYPATAHDVFTSGEATVELVVRERPGARVDVFGTPSLRRQFVEAGVALDEVQPDLVVLGFDTTTDYPKLVRLCAHVARGVPYWATHPDRTCPTEDGFIPDAGAFMALVEAATGRRPDRIVGKPERDIITALSVRTGLAGNELAIIGDRLYTDIATGLAAGIPAILVLSGETRRADLAGSPVQPNLVVEGLAELADRLAATT